MISVILFLFLSFACLTLIVRSPNLIFHSAIVGEFLRIALSSLLYKDFNEKAMEPLNRMKAQGHNPSGVEKHYPKLFEDMKKRLQVLGKIVMKLFLNLIFKLES